MSVNNVRFNEVQQEATVEAVVYVGLIESFASGCCNALDEIEGHFSRMLTGVFEFVTSSLPEWARRILFAGGRVAFKLAQVLLFMAIWVLVCFGPVLVSWRAPRPVLIAAAVWLLCGLIGSAYGLAYARRRFRLRWRSNRPKGEGSTGARFGNAVRQAVNNAAARLGIA